MKQFLFLRTRSLSIDKEIRTIPHFPPFSISYGCPLVYVSLLARKTQIIQMSLKSQPICSKYPMYPIFGTFSRVSNGRIGKDIARDPLHKPKLCSQQATSSLQFMYFRLKWFLKRVLNPQILLQFYRIITLNLNDLQTQTFISYSLSPVG